MDIWKVGVTRYHGKLQVYISFGHLNEKTKTFQEDSTSLPRVPWSNEFMITLQDQVAIETCLSKNLM